MKKLITIITCLLVSLKLLAQDCTAYYYMQKNKTIEMSTYDEKGAFVRKSVSNVSNVVTSSRGVTATVVSEIFDKNGKTDGKKTTISYTCNGGTIMIDINFNNKTGKTADNTKMNFVSMEYPAGMKVGDHLKDAVNQYKESIGKETIVATSKIVDRTVAARENVTTSAGSWNCLKITYKTITTLTGPYKVPPQTDETTEWYAPNFGIVKTTFKSLGFTMQLTGLK